MSDGRVIDIRGVQYGRDHERTEPLSDLDRKSIANYLNNPVSAGLWRLNAEWKKDSGISNQIWAEVQKEIENKDVLTIASGKRERKIKITEEWKNEIREETQNNITFFLTLFSYLVESENVGSDLVREFSATHELTQLILDIVPTKSIIEQYSEAYKFFKENIWFASMEPRVRVKEITKLKNGAFVTTKGPRTNGYLSAISWSGEPLKNLLRFLELLQKVDMASLMPIYSPEEEVFEPYFDLLEISYPYLVTQEHLRPLFRKSITHYKDGNFSDCVSATGLLAEDLLTQVYETLFREQFSKGLTLGQLADAISTRVDSYFQPAEGSAPDFTNLYQEIKHALESDSELGKAALEKIRKLLTLIIENNKYISTKIDGIGKQRQKRSVFPDRVIRSINELIKYRNASSHKSRIPIGPYESTRSIYSFMIFLIWWEQEKKTINWDLSAEDIIKNCANKNSMS